MSRTMVEEFDGKKGDEKYEEDFSNSLLYIESSFTSNWTK
jgi:hypothetical protein